MANPLHQLEQLAARGLQPLRREVWLGLGFAPPKRCAIAIDPAHLPTAAQCTAVAGLDVLLVYHGDTTRYGTLQQLCAGLYRAGPRRLQAIDIDAKRIAYLKLGRL
jgi:hypothetical protein